MECTFVVGQKVVFLGFRQKCMEKLNFPIVGGIYTVREVTLGYLTSVGGEVPCLLLKEIVNTPKLYKRRSDSITTEKRWAAHCFRPLTDLENKVEKGISLLRGISKDTVITEDGKQVKAPIKEGV